MDFTITNSHFDLRQTFLCGQCFRWTQSENDRSPSGGSFSGIACGRKISVFRKDNKIILSGVSRDDIPLWRNYFDLDTDYGAFISRFSSDKTLKMACECSPGIRILRQEPFETLISFIISQNNNIPRISLIISRLCENFGTKISEGDYAFPTAEQLRGITAEELAPLKAGFRARYIADAVQKVNSGEIDFAEIDALPLEPAREQLKRIVGVGDKVADCVLLFAFHKLNAFPKDVWVKRIMSTFYPNGLPACTKDVEGVAQQYLFDYVRNNNGLELVHIN